jgi:hypothetical protein
MIPVGTKGKLKKFPISDWIKRRGLKGRTYGSVKSRLVLLRENNFEIKYKRIYISERIDTSSKAGKPWDEEEIAELEKQMHKPVQEINLDGRNIRSILAKKHTIYVPGVSKAKNPNRYDFQNIEIKNAQDKAMLLKSIYIY